MTIPETNIPDFQGGYNERRKVRNRAKKHVMHRSGVIYNHVIYDLKRKHAQGGKTWSAECLRNVLFDMEMQRREEGVCLSPYVWVLALLNVHRKMKLWSHPELWRDINGQEADICCWRDLEDIVWKPFWKAILDLGEQSPSDQLWTMTLFGGVEGDVAFSHFLRQATPQLRGTNVRIITGFPVPNPSSSTYCWKGMDLNAVPPPRFLPDANPLHPNTYQQETMDVWRRSDLKQDTGEN